MIDIQQGARLVRQVQAHDERAFSELYEMYFPYVYYCALKYLRNEQDAQEVAQEVFVLVHRKIDTVKNPRAFHKWITSVTLNSCSGLVKTQSRKPEIDTEGDEAIAQVSEQKVDFIPEAYLETKELRQEVLNLVEELPLSQRKLVMMYYLGELPVSEIAQITEIREGTINRRLFDARGALRKKLDPDMRFSYADLSVGAIPVLSRILEQDAEAKALPHISSKVFQGVTSSLSTTATSGGAAHVAALSLKTKVMAGVIAAVLVTGVAGGVALSRGSQKDEQPVAPAPQQTSQASSQENDEAASVQEGESEKTSASEELPTSKASPGTVEETDPSSARTEESPRTSETVKTTKTTKVVSVPAPAIPVITYSKNLLEYPLNMQASPEQIIADSGARAKDASGKSIGINLKLYDTVGFSVPGSYFVLLTAQDQSGEYADPVTIRIIVR